MTDRACCHCIMTCTPRPSPSTFAARLTVATVFNAIKSGNSRDTWPVYGDVEREVSQFSGSSTKVIISSVLRSSQQGVRSANNLIAESAMRLNNCVL